MIIVKSLDAGFKVLVILQATVFQVHTTNGISLTLQVYIGFASHKRTEVSIDTHGVARHVEHQVRANHSHAVYMYLPMILAGSSIFWHRVVQLHIETGFFQAGAIDLNSLLVEVNTFAGKVETTEAALHLGSGNKVGCINAGISNL